ncbi:hypothetical protein N7492_002682 [Penicillium capsulatum]|uniref:Uncharacterized protein n=1 Tax=Penicillium capsulatum TaxID=69766 RepID=A0A9W9IKJ4_9EURO|nr:hypothetical protein N7492_002682 [Penicillium capsulatum]
MRLSNIAIGTIVALCGQAFSQESRVPKGPQTIAQANGDSLLTGASKSKQPLNFESPTGDEDQIWFFTEDPDNQGHYIQNADSGKYLYCSGGSACTQSRQAQIFHPYHQKKSDTWGFGEISSQMVLTWTDENTLKLVKNPSNMDHSFFTIKKAE